VDGVLLCLFSFGWVGAGRLRARAFDPAAVPWGWLLPGALGAYGVSRGAGGARIGDNATAYVFGVRLVSFPFTIFHL